MGLVEAEEEDDLGAEEFVHIWENSNKRVRIIVIEADSKILAKIKSP